MITPQNPLTIISPVIPEKLEELRGLLESIQYPELQTNTVLPFTQLSTVHFARFVILERTDDQFPLQLAFSLNFDGDEKSLMQELIKVAGPGLKKIYSCCAGFDGNLEKYWLSHKVKVPAFYNGHRGISLKQIRQEDSLQKAIADYLDDEYRKGAVRNKTAGEVKQQVADRFKDDSAFTWAVNDYGLSDFQQKVYHNKTIALTIVIGLAFLVLYLIFGGMLLRKLLHIGCGWGAVLAFILLVLLIGIPIYLMKVKLNKLEATDQTRIKTAAKQHVNKLMHAENFQVQNQLTHLVELKPGAFRLKTLKLVFGAINFLAKSIFNRGALGGIPSIHFARWVIIDNDKRLLFFSNFDGSWENYLGDFVDKASKGLTGVWSNTINFPRAKNLLFEGATDEQRFKEWARNLQVPTQVWYTAYKKLSVQNINNNAAIRAGLFRKMDEAGSQKWLNRIHQYQR
jgi:hypothetical protein